MVFASEQEAAMGRFVEGEDRAQQVLLPPSLEDYVGEDNPVRVVDVYIDELDLAELGFARVMPKATGRPAYHPSTLLKIYLYGYLNRIQSSRRLEREAGRNIELMWLTGRLAPDFKTIADFRKDNGPAIQAVCAQFIALCREIGLFVKAVAAIDGAKFKAVNARDRNFTRGKLKRRIEQVETSIGRYLQSLDAADAQEGDVAEEKVGRLREKVAAMKAKLQELKSLEATLIASPDHQISLTDPDARAMATSLRASGMVGYNVQTAVDTEHHLIVAHEVTNDVNDKAQLSRMAMKARSAMGTDTLDVLADRGYFSGGEILACREQDISPLVPKPYTSGAKAAGRYGKDDFLYDPDENAYRCPAGEMLTYRFTNVEKGQTLHSYWTTRCDTCALKPHCTTGPFRRIKRWEHEGVVDAMLKRLNGMPDAMNIRRRTVEHPFGTLKSWMGHTHFLTKGMEKVKTEMSLCVLAYNLKRMIAILGVEPLITAIRA
jgi:transposase